MSVRVAASAGFCFGVDRAVGLVEQTVREGKRAVTLGPIIHNHHVVQHFAALGVREIASPEEVPGGSAVIIRSHGVSRAVYEALQARGLEIIDATCPFVSRIHRIVQEAEANGRQPLIIGTPEHPEVVAIGYTRLKLIFFAYIFTTLYENMSGYLRGFGISLLPALLTAVGICGLRVVWVYTVFRANPTFQTVMTVYPVSLSTTAVLVGVALLICHPARRHLKAGAENLA